MVKQVIKLLTLEKEVITVFTYLKKQEKDSFIT